MNARNFTPGILVLVAIIGTTVMGPTVSAALVRDTTSAAAVPSSSTAVAPRLIVYNRDFISQIRFAGNWSCTATVHGTRWRHAGPVARQVTFRDEEDDTLKTLDVPVSGEVLVSDFAVFFNFVDQQTVPSGTAFESGELVRVPAPRTTIYNWNNVIKYSTSGTCWDTVGTDQGCTTQKCKTSGGSGDCKFTVNTTTDCWEHTCTCNGSGTLNGWALCRVDGTFSTDCAGTVITCQ